MSNHVQESIDICIINWREDKASREGTQALRYVVLSLHDAQVIAYGACVDEIQ